MLLLFLFPWYSNDVMGFCWIDENIFDLFQYFYQHILKAVCTPLPSFMPLNLPLHTFVFLELTQIN